MTTTKLTAADLAHRNHRRAVRFFWFVLGGATLVSLIGNIAHAVLPYLWPVAIQIGVAAVPPIVLLAAVHGIALAVRAGASGAAYRWAVTAVTVIGAGAFALSFIALRDLMQTIGYSPAVAWIFPTIVDTAVGVSTVMLVALGDKPARRSRTSSTAENAPNRTSQGSAESAKPQVTLATRPDGQAEASKAAPASVQRGRVQEVQHLASEAVQSDADLAAELIASRATTQPVETVLAVLKQHRDGASINAAAKAAGINYRTAQRIVDGVTRRQELVPAG